MSRIHFGLPKFRNVYQFLTAQSQRNDLFDHLYFSGHGKARNIKFGQQINRIQRIPSGTSHQEVVSSLSLIHRTLTNLFISSYRGATDIKFEL